MTIVNIEYRCGHIIRANCSKKKADVPAYLERKKERFCPACIERRERARMRLHERQVKHRSQIQYLHFMAACINAVNTVTLTPLEERYVRHLLRRFK